MPRSLDSQLNPTVPYNQGQSCCSCPPSKDSEDDATQKEQVKAKKSTRRRKKKAVTTKVPEPIEVAKDISSMEVFELPVVNGWMKCQECTFYSRNQDILDLHLC